MLAVDVPPEAEDLLKRAWAAIEEFMDLRPNEATYISDIERGELRPELLFSDDPEATQCIANHPAILWKITNVRAHLAKRERKDRDSARED